MQRMTGVDRRAQIVQIAAEEFARAGLHGTSAETIARRAGISQPYIFRLFGTKKALFQQVVAEAFNHMTAGMAAVAGELRGVESLEVIGAEYRRRLADRTGLLLQLQGFAACDDPEVRETVQAAFGNLWTTIAEISGLDPMRVKVFIGIGMLLNDAAAMELADLDTEWARACLVPVPAEFFRQ